MQLSITEQLAYSTVRLECLTKTGNVQTGTGFFFKFLEKGDQHVPVIITNKHVVKNAVKGKFILTKSDKDGNPINTEHFTAEFVNFEQQWKMHPDANVDLCAMALAPVVNYAQQQRVNLFYRVFDKNLLPQKEQQDEFTALEDVLMIGYPNGIWDSVNNQPIFRKGTTATHPNIDYNGKKEFMIDVACFPGSSGSPVLIYNASSYTTKSGGTIMGGTRIILIGVLYAGPQHTATGEIKIVNVPQFNQPLSISRIPNNLGICLKAERILELEKLFE
ncbi:S1 family peptidase [Changchengzhania lutea]|uniref:S1 family peptidase n=1 Tax=Changchengzhania lutea TaxID=2049305 RepID=UPI00163D7C29|nr:serine protease [Changchengzhania lutea]